MNNSQSKRKPYVRDVKKTWWVKHPFYRFYMLREFTSVFASVYVVLLLWGLLRLSQGAAAFATWQEAMQNPIAIIFHLLALLAMVYHAITWFALAPKAMRLFIGEQQVPDKPIILGQYVALAVVSLLILAIFIF